MPAGDETPDLPDVEPDGPVTPYCLPCVRRDHDGCLARTTPRFCECAACWWIWPDGVPFRFWRP